MDIAAPVKQYNKLREQTNPNIEELETFIKATKSNNNSQNIKALRLKYLAITTVPTTIQKTVSPAQLYASDNPLWALNFAGYDINKLFKRLENQPKTEEAFNTALYNIQNPMLVLDEFGNLRLNKRHPNNSM